MKRILCSLLVATLPFGSVLAAAPKSKKSSSSSPPLKMTPPVWLDDQGHRRPTRPCSTCGRETPIRRLRAKPVAAMRSGTYPPLRW